VSSKPIIEPYVTTNGGVVILNGPFPIKKANRIAALCKAAPDLLEVCKQASGLLSIIPEVNRNPVPKEIVSAKRWLDSAIAKAEGRE
jgi:hypothetical protein